MCIYLPFPADDAYFYHFGDTGRPNLRRETVIAGVRNRAGARWPLRRRPPMAAANVGRLSGRDDCRTPLN
jgi:hypothetical protein